ncbi:hypothetical protein Zm00014a_027147 [Zea mays]|uniref:Uncharacterized protein n=1 Tax=Zea mays TaxID=4577 RepID=A0A317YBS4_MAIZE|nr:hypothetical protein Zm00014a_027147 [Zea mays]
MKCVFFLWNLDLLLWWPWSPFQTSLILLTSYYNLLWVTNSNNLKDYFFTFLLVSSSGRMVDPYFITLMLWSDNTLCLRTKSIVHILSLLRH